MSKAEDTREQAKRIYFARCDEAKRLAPQFEEEEVIDLLARAILAAKAEEREACASMLEDMNVDYLDRFSAAIAIRKRGEG